MIYIIHYAITMDQATIIRDYSTGRYAVGLLELQNRLNALNGIHGGLTTMGVTELVLKSKYQEIYGLELQSEAIKHKWGDPNTQEVFTDGPHPFTIIWKKRSDEECRAVGCCCNYEYYFHYMGVPT